MLPSQIVNVLNFFDVMGYCTGSTALTKYRQIRLLIHVMHSVFAVLFTMYMFQLSVELYQVMGLLETLNELAQYSVALNTYWLIILDSFLHRYKHRSFWMIVQLIDEHFCSQTVFLRGYLCKIFEYFPVTLISSYLIYFLKAVPQVRAVFIGDTLITICQLRVFYYLFCLEVVNWQLKMIETEVKIMKSVSPMDDKTHPFREFDLKRFKWINKYYDCVMEMTELLNDIFGWSQIASILCCFYTLLTNLNWLYANLDRLSVTHSSGSFQVTFKLPSIFCDRKTEFLVSIFWMVHTQLIIFYLFRGAYLYSVTVSF